MAAVTIMQTARPSMAGTFRPQPMARFAALPLRVCARRTQQLRATGGNYGGGGNFSRDANQAADDTAAEAGEKLERFFEDLQEKWEKNNEKPTTVVLGLAAFVALWSAGGLVDAINRLPLISGLLEVIGLGVSGWFVYRYLGTAEDRKELKREIDSFLNKVGVSK